MISLSARSTLATKWRCPGNVLKLTKHREGADEGHFKAPDHNCRKTVDTVGALELTHLVMYWNKPIIMDVLNRGYMPWGMRGKGSAGWTSACWLLRGTRGEEEGNEGVEGWRGTKV